MNSWMNLPEEYRDGKCVILPLPYEHEVTYGKGASRGPEEIIKASYYLEYYDVEQNSEPYQQGITLRKPLPLQHLRPEAMIARVADAMQKESAQPEKKKFIIGLGGDHAVTLGMVKWIEHIHDDFSIIILDAHADFRDSWNGSMFNHACVSRQLAKKHDLLLLGVRSMDADEARMITERKHVHLVKNSELSLRRVKSLLSKLKKKVYLSIDADVFDPSFIRNTGTPEPGGLFWNQAIQLLQLIFQEKNVIGADVVEFAPQENFRAEAYALAKLIYRIMALASRTQQEYLYSP